MSCPNCGGNLETIKLLDKYKDEFFIDRCAICGGFWLTFSSLKRLVKEEADNLDVFTASDKLDSFGLSCPKCFIPMEEYSHPQYENLILQRCPECHGLWAKRGQIAQYLKLRNPHRHIKQHDSLGSLPSRDRVIASFVSIAIMAGSGISIAMYQAGTLQMAADSLRSQTENLLPLYLAIGSSVVIFAAGLFLAMYKFHRTIRLLGWSIALFGLALIIYLGLA